MEVIGKITHKLEPQSGTSKAGNAWTKQEYVLQTQEAYPKSIFFSFFGDRANQYPLEVGQTVRLSFDIDSHEYNGRWFTNINGWKAEQVDPAMAVAPAPAQQPQQFAGAPSPTPYDVAPQAAASPDFSVAGSADDLPF